MRAALAWSIGVAVALVALEWAVARGPHPAGLAALAGAVGCVLIVVASKALGKAWLQRPEPDDE
jgi:hypothetical protein